MKHQDRTTFKSIDIAFQNITYGVKIPEKSEGLNLPCNTKY
jgi:hypothetical protein